jgi:hypothetical protein
LIYSIFFAVSVEHASISATSELRTTADIREDEEDKIREEEIQPRHETTIEEKTSVVEADLTPINEGTLSDDEGERSVPSRDLHKTSEPETEVLPSSPPPPLPSKSTRPPSISQAAQVSPPSEHDSSNHPPAPPARNLPPPPPKLIPQIDDAEEEANDSDLARSQYSEAGARSPSQPLSSRPASDDEEEGSTRPTPFRNRSEFSEDASASDYDSETSPLPVPSRQAPQKRTSLQGSAPARRPPFRAIPLSPATSTGSEAESDGGEALQIPPRRRPDSPGVPIVIPPPHVIEEATRGVEPSPLRQSHRAADHSDSSPERAKRSSDHLSLPKGNDRNQEILDEDEGG